MSQATPGQPIHPGAGVRPVEAFMETYDLVFRNLPTVGRLLLVPIGVAAAGGYWAAGRQLQAMQRMVDTGETPGFDPVQLIPVFVQLLVFVSFATAWHRWILIGPAAGVPGIGLTWRRIEWMYLSALVALYLLSFVVVALGASLMVLLTALTNSPPLAIVIFTLTLALSIYVFCRLCLVLPGAAVGEDEFFRTAPRRSNTRVFRIFLAFLLVFLPIVLADVAVYLVLVPGDVDALGQTPEAMLQVMERLWLPSLIAGLVLYALTVSLFVALLSVLYRQLTGFGQGGAGAQQ